MPGKPPEPSAPEPSAPQPGGGGTADGGRREEERLGPIVLARHRKDDGRALILYRRPDAETR